MIAKAYIYIISIKIYNKLINNYLKYKKSHI